MLFNTYLFLFGFLPVALAGWWWIRGPNLRLAFLTCVSWFFYAWWDWHFLPIMIVSTSVDYLAGLAMRRTDDRRWRKVILIASISYNLAILAYFKYVGFFGDSLNGIARLVGIDDPLPRPAVFDLIAGRSRVAEAELQEVFNLGCGFCCVVPADQSVEATKQLDARHPGAAVIGTVTDRAGVVEVAGQGLEGRAGTGFAEPGS